MYLKVVSAATFSKNIFFVSEDTFAKMHHHYFQTRQKSIKISVSGIRV